MGMQKVLVKNQKFRAVATLSASHGVKDMMRRRQEGSWSHLQSGARTPGAMLSLGIRGLSESGGVRANWVRAQDRVGQTKAPGLLSWRKKPANCRDD
jgi:hypothetical protein